MIELIAACTVVVVTVLYLYNTLRHSASTPECNSIEAFIDQDDGMTRVFEGAQHAGQYKQDYTEKGCQVLILYGTEYGCSEEIAKLLYDRIILMSNEQRDFPIQPRLVNAKHYSTVDFAREQVCFIIISTSGDGVPPTDARPFYDYVLNNDLDLQHVNFSVLALGDSNYPQFCKTGKVVYNRFSEFGSSCILPLSVVDMEDWSVINMWLDGVEHFLKGAELEAGYDYIRHADMEEEQYSRNKPYMATLKAKRLLTVCDTPEDKETIHCEFDLSGSGLTWISGDALGIYPQNNPSEVDRLLQAMRTKGTISIPKPTWAYQEEGVSNVNISLKLCLQKFYDLKTVKTDLLETLRKSVKDLKEKQKLESLLKDGVSSQNEVLKIYLSEVEVADVLFEFKSHSLSWQQVLKCMKSLQPRYYSISSSPKIDETTACVTAAVVRYQTRNIPRTGVTTTFLNDWLSVGAECPVFMSRNPDFRLPNNAQLPVILIGPGTGLAPFMAFIQERALEPDSGPTWLFFGCRHRKKDYLYQEQLDSWASGGLITLRVAFSRDQEQKVYVQDLLLEDKAKIWHLISNQQGSIYVCGDAKHMAHDVHTTLIDIVKGEGHMSESEAVTYLQNMEGKGQYQKDVWVI